MYSRRQDTRWTQLSRWILTGSQSKGKLVFYLGKRHSFDGMHSRCRGYKNFNAVDTPSGYASHEQACNDGMQA